MFLIYQNQNLENFFFKFSAFKVCNKYFALKFNMTVALTKYLVLMIKSLQLVQINLI